MAQHERFVVLLLLHERSVFGVVWVGKFAAFGTVTVRLVSSSVNPSDVDEERRSSLALGADFAGELLRTYSSAVY